MIRLWLSLAAAGVFAVTPAGAQDISAPRVELGGGLGVLVPMSFRDGAVGLLSIGPRATVNVTREIGIELLADVLSPVEHSGVHGFYLTQLKIPIRQSARRDRSLEVAIGAAGPFWYTHRREQRLSRPDGSVVVHPSYRTFRARAPNTISIGLVREQVVARYTAGSLTVHAFLDPRGGFALRAAAGLSFGRYQ